MLLGPDGCSLRVSVDPTGEVKRQAVRIVDTPEAVDLGERVHVPLPAVKRAFGQPRLGMGGVEVKQGGNGSFAALRRGGLDRAAYAARGASCWPLPELRGLWLT